MFGVSQIAGALMMYGIGSTEHAIATWRVMFMVCGGLTVAAGILFVACMPKNTNTAWFLNEREREIATNRLAIDRATRDRANFDWAQVGEALRDPRTALFAATALFITIPTPIVKVGSNSRELAIRILTVSVLVLLSRHQRLRLLQVPDHARWPAQWSHSIRIGLDWRPGP